jgi:hypothetical protein
MQLHPLVAGLLVSQAWAQTITGSTTIGPPASEAQSDNSLLIALCIIASVWLLFLSFGASRVSGYLVSKLLQRFLSKDRQAYCSIGSVSVSMLSGMVTFRDFRYITQGFGLTAVDGFVQIRCVTMHPSVLLRVPPFIAV